MASERGSGADGYAGFVIKRPVELNLGARPLQQIGCTLLCQLGDAALRLGTVDAVVVAPVRQGVDIRGALARRSETT